MSPTGGPPEDATKRAGEDQDTTGRRRSRAERERRAVQPRREADAEAVATTSRRSGTSIPSGRRIGTPYEGLVRARRWRARGSAGGSSRRWSRGTAATPGLRTTSRSPAPRRAPRTGVSRACAQLRAAATTRVVGSGSGPVAAASSRAACCIASAWSTQASWTASSDEVATSGGYIVRPRTAKVATRSPAPTSRQISRGADEGTARRLVASERAGRADHPAVLAGPVAASAHRHRHRRGVQEAVRGRAEHHPAVAAVVPGTHDDHARADPLGLRGERARRGPTLDERGRGAPGRDSGRPGSPRPPGPRRGRATATSPRTRGRCAPRRAWARRSARR